MDKFRGKKHGISLEHIDTEKVHLVIVPDAGTNDVKQCKQLQEHGIDILITDHHEIEESNPYAVVINCQDGKYPNHTYRDWETDRKSVV